MSAITTHILDISRGQPAAGVEVVLSRRGEAGGWQQVAGGTTDADGRVGDLLPTGEGIEAGVYRLRLTIAPYFASLAVESFYPWADVVFSVAASGEHYHVPLLLSPYGYSTYRGS
jgi:5-hydroxyisourate hydrolase